MTGFARKIRPALLIAVAACFLWWMLGNRLLISADEGIYLDGAAHLLHGSLPYRDFFALTGPGTFWNLAVLFKLFGTNLGSARILLVADLSLLAACVYWLTAELMSEQIAVWLTGLYLAFLFLNPDGLLVNHRWDSCALFTLAVCFFYQALKNSRSVLFFAAGIASAYAAWITPATLLFLAIFLLWLLLVQPCFRSALFVALGAAFVSVPAILYLAATGSLQPMLQHLLWTANNYGKANHVYFGHLVGGYSALFAHSQWPAIVVIAGLLIFITLPATAVLMVPLGSLFGRQNLPRHSGFLLLSTATAALVSYPRVDMPHLHFAAALSYPIAAAMLTRLIPERLRLGIAGGLTFGALLFVFSAVQQRVHFSSQTSRIGNIAGDRDELRLAGSLQRLVNPGQTFFSFPYMPIAYFLTQGTNPTRFSFLQVGMMTSQDEAVTLAELEKTPPSVVLYSKIIPQQYLRVFPSSKPSELQMPRIEAWLDSHYDHGKEPPLLNMELLIRKPERQPTGRSTERKSGSGLTP